MMDFFEGIYAIKSNLEKINVVIDKDKYDGLIVKKLTASNTISESRTNTKQTHIAITGKQMDLFPYIHAYGYCDVEYEQMDKDLKKYLLLQIPMYLHKADIDYLDDKSNIKFITDEKLVNVCVWRRKGKEGSSEQIQLSNLSQDSKDFITFRKTLPVDSYMIILKRKQELKYDIFGIRSEDLIDEVSNLNNEFLKLSEVTPVKLNEVLYKQDNSVFEELIYNTKINYLINEKYGQSSNKFKKHLYSRNLIVFGAPGTGKSNIIKSLAEEFTKQDESLFERVTFHPEYNHANFVGTYKPIAKKEAMQNEDGTVSKKKSISYEYVPGPFMKMLVKALRNARDEEDNVKPHILIVEEINRANPAAVFGELFQLLDRDSDQVSEYSVATSNEMAQYLADELGGTKEDYPSIKLPNNMFIWATMNSADQGVFPMDTAFKRRWEYEYLDIDEGEQVLIEKGFNREFILGGETITWNSFRKAINKILLDEGVNEDKLMGPFFISPSILKQEDAEIFLNALTSKVLMYLFEDAAGRQKRDKIFNNARRYSQLANEFTALNGGLSIFQKNIQQSINDYIKEDETNYRVSESYSNDIDSSNEENDTNNVMLDVAISKDDTDIQSTE